jgi:hypothetical protein
MEGSAVPGNGTFLSSTNKKLIILIREIARKETERKEPNK